MKALVLLAALLAAAQARSAHHKLQHQGQVEQFEGQDVYLPEGGDSRIVSGGTASRGQFPYHVAIYLDGRSFCDGSLISQRWVLTAAACTQGITTFTIYLGASNLAATEGGRIVISTTSKIVHSGYNSATLNNNVALVNLGQEVALSTYIKPVPIATGSGSYVGQKARLTGWRLISSGSPPVGNTLQSANLTIVASSECSGGSIITSYICAKFAEGLSSCGASMGAPLVLLETGEQIGAVSALSSKGCTEGAPVAFSRAASYASWISANTGIAL